MHVKTTDGNKVIHPASGLVTALEPVMRACSGVWVAHGSGSADRETVDIKDRIPVPPGEGSYLLRRVWLTERRRRATTTASPTRGCGRSATSRTRARCSAPRTGPTTARSTASSPTRCARRSIATTRSCWCRTTTSRLAPRMIRETLPRATIIMFWHIPWPNAERFGICPWREELLAGMLGSSIARLPHPAPLQQLHRLGRRLPGEPHRSRGARGGAGRPQHAGAAVSDLDRVAGALARGRGADPSGAGRRAARAGPGARRAARRRRRSPRLHQGHRGAPAGGRASCCAATRSSAGASPSCSWPRPAAPRSSATAS